MTEPADTVTYIARTMRSVARGLRTEGLDVTVPVRWAPPDEEVFAGNVDFGEADIQMGDFLDVLAQMLEEVDPPNE